MTDRTAEEILDALAEKGTMPTELEVVALCDAAIECGHMADTVEALTDALTGAGWSVLDMTTDDSDGTEIELVPPTAGDP